MYKNEIAFKDHWNGMQVAEMLLQEGNVVLLSYEEDLLIVNWEWCESGFADRNEVVFMSRCEYEEELDKAFLQKIDTARVRIDV